MQTASASTPRRPPHPPACTLFAPPDMQDPPAHRLLPLSALPAEPPASPATAPLPLRLTSPSSHPFSSGALPTGSLARSTLRSLSGPPRTRPRPHPAAFAPALQTVPQHFVRHIFFSSGSIPTPPCVLPQLLPSAGPSAARSGPSTLTPPPGSYTSATRSRSPLHTTCGRTRLPPRSGLRCALTTASYPLPRAVFRHGCLPSPSQCQTAGSVARSMTDPGRASPETAGTSGAHTHPAASDARAAKHSGNSPRHPLRSQPQSDWGKRCYSDASKRNCQSQLYSCRNTCAGRSRGPRRIPCTAETNCRQSALPIADKGPAETGIRTARIRQHRSFGADPARYWKVAGPMITGTSSTGGQPAAVHQKSQTLVAHRPFCVLSLPTPHKCKASTACVWMVASMSVRHSPAAMFFRRTPSSTASRKMEVRQAFIPSIAPFGCQFLRQLNSNSRFFGPGLTSNTSFRSWHRSG